MEDIKEKLIDKLEKEFEDYIRNVKSEGVDGAIESSYEIVSKTEIKDYLTFAKLDKKEIKALLKQNGILDQCYMSWLKADGNFYESLEFVLEKEIRNFTKEALLDAKKQNKGAR